MKRLLFLIFCISSTSFAQADTSLLQSERAIPLAYEADVVVVGGTTGAVTAAIAAAENGASVFLAAPKPYLGEDVCGTLRLWLQPDEQPQTALEKKLFVAPDLESIWINRLPFTYETDIASDSAHADSNPPGKLADKRAGGAVHESVQFSNDVTIIAKLEGNKRVKQFHLLAYRREGEFEVAEMQVWTSPNGTQWRDLGVVKNENIDAQLSENTPNNLTLTIEQPCSHIKVLVRKAESVERMLLGELIVIEDRPVLEKTDQARQPPTPMQVKYALDQALIDAGVTFLYGSPVTDVLRDENGELAGVVMANRAGRQAVKAKTIIDATMRGTVARIAGAKCVAYPSQPQTFQRIVVGGEPQSAPGLRVEQADVKFASQDGVHDVFVYSMDIALKDTHYASFADAEQQFRDLTFDVALVDESDFLFQVPPDPIISQASSTVDEFDPATVSLGVTQPSGLTRLFVLGGAADVSRTAAATLTRPLNLMRLGTRVGAASAEQVGDLGELKGLTVAGHRAEDIEEHISVHEFLQGPRPSNTNMPTVPSPECALPILGQYDVVVVGGGTGGAPAAISAARRGSKTLLIEYQDHLGGVGTLGLISSYYHGYRKGFSSEVDKSVAAMGGPERRGGWNPIAKREYWRAEARKAGCDVWFSTLGVGTLLSGDFVKGVVVATPTQRGAVLAKIVVDATGNADVAAAAGAETISTSSDHVAMQGTGLSPRALGTGYTNTDYSFSDESDQVDQWRMIVSARRKYKDSYDISPFIDSRERRRIVGEVFITPLDLMNGRTYFDTIAMHQSNFDTHGFTVHPVFLINFPDKKQMTVPVPYRALLPKGLDGILVTGLAISAHRDAIPILRMQACIQNQGYAAGVAAAMAAERNTSLRSINMPALQQHLIEIGSLEPDVLTQRDSAVMTTEQIALAVKSVVHEYRGLAVVLENSDAALPLLRTALTSASSDEDKLVYANILGMLGDSSGGQVLIDAVDGAAWDTGWNFRGMGQFGGSISRLDSHIIALGRSGAAGALATIIRKLEQLDASTEFSHHRAVAMALETLADSRAAKPLAELLRKEGMMGYAITEISAAHNASGNETRSQPLREIILARALYRCGDVDGLGTQILQTYEHDLRGLFAQHATAVLRE